MLKLLILTLSLSSNAATIAVIDSGVDIEHQDLVQNLWNNPVDIPGNYIDEDNNGYQDDFFGWNFAGNDSEVIDRKYIGTFSDDPYTFFEIQARQFMGTLTEEDIAWLKSKREDKEFRAEMAKFGNFVHGTHVAGITAKDSPQAKILSVKLIPTEVKPFADSFDVTKTEMKDGVRMKLLKAALSKLATTQMDQLEEIAHYVGSHGSHVANGSFGSNFAQIKMITDNLYKIFFFKAPTKEQSDLVAKFFMDTLIKDGERMLAAAPRTLFVFAAGNNGTDNDLYGTSPANIKADNAISVAATYQNKYLAPFSNFGTKTVDIAAPGMLINSQIPGNKYLRVSGTSQAAPFVANIAGQIHDENPELTPKQIKKILMSTVDKKSFLSSKVKSKGVVNSERALFAARSSRTMALALAIAAANLRVRDASSSKFFSTTAFGLSEVQPLPLPQLFSL